MEKLSPYELENAAEGSLFIKKGNKLVSVSFKELSKDLESKCNDALNIKQKADANEKNIYKLSIELETLVKSHFITVFSLFELKALKGEIEIDDENLLNLDEEVVSGRLSVKDAVMKHPYLKETYESLFGKVGK